MDMNQRKPAIVEESNLVAMPSISNERSMWALMMEQATELVKSGMLPAAIKTPAAALAIMQTGRELGMQQMAALRNIHIINGKPVLAAQLMAGLVNQYCAKHGGYLRQAELSEQRCVIEYKRAEWPDPQRFSFSMDDAKRAGLAGKENWANYPREMMYNRAVANACRMGWPEITAGIYDPDEVTPSVVEASYSIRPSQQPTEHHAAIEAPAQDARDRANARYFAIVTSKGLTTDERRALQRIAYGVASARELSRDQLVEMANMIELKDVAELREAIAIQMQMDAEDAAIDPDTGEIIETTQPHPAIQHAIDQREANWIAAMEGAATMGELSRIGTEIGMAQMGDDARSRLRSAWNRHRDRIQGGAKPTRARTVNDIAGELEQVEMLANGDPDRFTR